MRPHTDARERDGPTRDANAKIRARSRRKNTARVASRRLALVRRSGHRIVDRGHLCTMSTLDDATLSKRAQAHRQAAQREKRRAERKESERAAKRGAGGEDQDGVS